MKNILRSFIFVLISVNAFAGGGGVGPVITDTELVHCRTHEPNPGQITELIYFLRSVTQWGGTTNEPGIYITGNQFSVTIYSSDKNIHQILVPQDQPQDIKIARPQISAFGYNIRAFNVDADGEMISLSLVAGATGKEIVQNLKMTCSAQ